MLLFRADSIKAHFRVRVLSRKLRWLSQVRTSRCYAAPLRPHPPLWSVFTHVASIYANLLEQKKAFAWEKS